MKIDPKRLRLYAVTDRAWTHDAEGLLRQVAAAVDGGAGIVQLREKHMGQADFLAEAERFVALCREKGAVSIINDNVEIAAQTGADGVHVGQEDLEAGRARELLGPDKLIGVSAHSVEEALAAQAAGADYLGVGAAFVTGTKSDAAKQVGMNVAERAKAKGIENVVFDRGGYVYHGRVKALAEGAREGGLQF